MNSSNETLKVIKERRSTRKYKSEQIKDVDLEAIIEAGLYAPSATNNQSWHFTVIQNPEVLEMLNTETKEIGKNSPVETIRKMSSNEKFNVFYNAPTVVIISSEDKALLAEVNCAAAMENMSIAAEALDLGTVWIGTVKGLFESEKREEVMKKLEIPEGYSPFLSVAIGYKDGNGGKAPARKESKVNYIK